MMPGDAAISLFPENSNIVTYSADELLINGIQVKKHKYGYTEMLLHSKLA